MIKKILRCKAVSLISLTACAFVVGGWLWAHFALRGVENAPLILHFDDLHGITAVGGGGALTSVGLLGMVIVIMNFLIALELEARDRFLGKLAAAATLIFAVLLFVGFAAIIKAN